MRRFMSASLLALVLACSAYAGDMPFGFTGEMPFGATGQSTTTNTTQEPQASENTITQVVLTILNGVLNFN